MVHTQVLYEGKAKKMHLIDGCDYLRVEYLDQVTALNGTKKDQLNGKGALNNQITARIFTELTRRGIDNHFINQLSKHEQLVERLEIVKLEVVIRNSAAGSFSKRFGIEEGTPLLFPVLEFYYKEDSLDDPFINEDHIKLLGIADEVTIKAIKVQAHKINKELCQLFAKIQIKLIDFKVEFGQRPDGTIILADEVTPDTCRLWDRETNKRLDKDLYRKNLGDILPVYEEVLQRLTQMTD